MKQIDDASREAIVMFLTSNKVRVLEAAKARDDVKLGKVTLGYPEKALSDTYVKPKRRA